MPKTKYVGCIIKELPDYDTRLRAAYFAIAINPTNAARGVKNPEHIAVNTQKMWDLARVKNLTYGYMERVSAEFHKKMDLYLNKWNEFTCARFVYSKDNPVIRIAFENTGYWSYLGPDALQIPPNQQTMNFQGLTLKTPESEWERVVPHEAGHALGCEHEHRRKKIIDKLDPQKTYNYFRQTQEWSKQEVDQQILTPLEEYSLMGSPDPDEESIMTYSFPGAITKNGKPILGGSKINSVDRQYMGKVYPKDGVVIPPQPPVSKKRLTIEFDGDYRIVDAISV